MLGESGAGGLLAPDDVYGWTQAIAGFARDRTALAAAGAAALQRHEAHGTWADTAAGVAEFLDSMQVAHRAAAPASARPTREVT